MTVTRKDRFLDEESVREFLAAGYPRLVDGMALMSGNRAAAEDAVQEALARAWERSDRGEHIERLEAWVTTAATNLLRSRFRRLRVERRARPRLAPPAVEPPSGEAAEVRRAVRSLPRRQREVTVLRYYLDLDVSEIAGALRVSDGTVKRSLHRARAALAERLGEPDDEEVERATP